MMFYFKDEPVPPSEIDLTQLTRVNDFRKKLGAKGILYWGFKSTGEFRQLVRIHLSKELQQHTPKSASGKNCTPDLDSLAAESEKQAFALLKIIEQHYTALGEHEDHLEKTDNFDDFLNATDLLCDKLEPTVGAFVKHVNYTVEAWINEFIALTHGNLEPVLMTEFQFVAFIYSIKNLPIPNNLQLDTNIDIAPKLPMILNRRILVSYSPEAA